MRIGICDDEKFFIKTIEDALIKILDKYDIPFNIQTFLNGYDLIEKQKNFDLIFLDITMPNIDGLSVAEKIREINDDLIIVFITSHEDKVFEAFKVKTFRYLVKPVDQEKLEEAIIGAHKEYCDDNVQVFIKDVCHNIRKINMDDIVYVETHNRNLLVHTLNHSFEAALRMKEIEHMLGESNFYRIHTSYIVNLKHVIAYNHNTVSMINGHDVMISRLKIKDFKNKLL